MIWTVLYIQKVTFFAVYQALTREYYQSNDKYWN